MACGENREVRLEIAQEQIPGGARLCPSLKNIGGQPLFVDSVEILRAAIPGGAALRYLRFGLNMPSDPVYFGFLGADAETPIKGNSLLAYRHNADVTVIGAGSFNVTEGTPSLTLENDVCVFILCHASGRFTA